MLVVVAVVVPGWIGMAAIIYSFYSYEREHEALVTIATARTLSAAVDAELQKTIVTAQALATSSLLAAGDIAGFYRVVSKFVPVVFGNNIVLADASGQEVFNTLRPFGDPLPIKGDAETRRRAFETGRPVISDLFTGQISKEPVISIDVPVFQGGAVKYTFSIGLRPDNFTSLLLRQKLPPHWIAAILDTANVIAARNVNPERFVGRQTTLQIRKAMEAAGKEGALEVNSVDGIPLLGAFSRSEFSHWTVVVGTPAAELSGSLNRLLLLCSAGLAVSLGIGLALAAWQSSQIARAVKGLIAPARALGQGEAPNIPPLGVREANDVAQEIVRASQLLHRETQERKSAQEKVQKFNEELETRVAERTTQLNLANEELEAFAYVASHDLKAPLRVIDNASQWLEEDLQEHLTGANRDNMRLLRGRVRRMEKLLDDLLEYSRIGRITDRGSLDPVTGDALIANVLALLSPPQNFTVTVSESFAAIQIPRMPLQQVLINLVGNAIKHHDKDEGHIEITAADCGEHLLFAVQDDGPGIPAQFHDLIFKMFQTLKPKDQVEGSGIGLALVRKSVEMVGGKLDLESTEGKGSVFRFTWPKPPHLNI
jgi:signal transduction histidine kinase